MTPTDALERWRQQSEAAFGAVTAWRQAHPTATLTDIETALDTELQRVRASLLQDLVLDSAARSWSERDAASAPLCPQCGTPLQPRGTHTRHVRTLGDQPLAFARTYGVCPVCTTGVFPPR